MCLPCQTDQGIRALSIVKKLMKLWSSSRDSTRRNFQYNAGSNAGSVPHNDINNKGGPVSHPISYLKSAIFQLWTQCFIPTCSSFTYKMKAVKAAVQKRKLKDGQTTKGLHFSLLKVNQIHPSSIKSDHDILFMFKLVLMLPCQSNLCIDTALMSTMCRNGFNNIARIVCLRCMLTKTEKPNPRSCHCNRIKTPLKCLSGKLIGICLKRL